jgi:hypothetical protein
MLAVKNSLGDFYFRSNCLKRFMGLGYNMSAQADSHHAAEVGLDWDTKTPSLRLASIFHLAGGKFT